MGGTSIDRGEVGKSTGGEHVADYGGEGRSDDCLGGGLFGDGVGSVGGAFLEGVE